MHTFPCVEKKRVEERVQIEKCAGMFHANISLLNLPKCSKQNYNNNNNNNNNNSNNNLLISNSLFDEMIKSAEQLIAKTIDIKQF